MVAHCRQPPPFFKLFAGHLWVGRIYNRKKALTWMYFIKFVRPFWLFFVHFLNNHWTISSFALQNAKLSSALDSIIVFLFCANHQFKHILNGVEQSWILGTISSWFSGFSQSWGHLGTPTVEAYIPRPHFSGCWLQMRASWRLKNHLGGPKLTISASKGALS